METYTQYDQYYVLTLHPRIGEVFEFIRYHAITFEVHLNRTRFWVPPGSVQTEFLLRFADSCPRVELSDAYSQAHY